MRPSWPEAQDASRVASGCTLDLCSGLISKCNRTRLGPVLYSPSNTSICRGRNIVKALKNEQKLYDSTTVRDLPQ
nr:hypothetical protein CFP56_24058 [Quercus suber]